MINILALTIQNIGPFTQSKTVLFPKKNILIKAPIGSGKSFLFFDAPLFALYKYSSRPILNIQSKEGKIQLLCEVQDEIYLITRIITKSKVKESCTSTLQKIDISPLQQQEIFEEQQEVFSEKSLDEIIKQFTKESIEFKNETDLQQTRETLLPPKEVFTNTVFLLQDSDNIFELTPSERIQVLKNVFNLLGIDEAKDIIQDKKREVGYKIKALQDTSKSTEKIQFLTSSYLNNLTKITIPETDVYIRPILEKTQELENIQEKITTNNLETTNFPSDFIEPIMAIIQDKKDTFQILQGGEKEITLQISQLIQKAQEAKNTIHTLSQTNKFIEEKLHNISPEKITLLKQEKAKLTKESEQQEGALPYQQFQTLITQNPGRELTIPTNKEHIYTNIQQLITLGKMFQQQADHAQEQKKQLEQQITTLKTNIQNLEKNIQTESTFSCEKIQANCPFIQVINKKAFAALEEQKQSLISQLTLAETKLTRELAPLNQGSPLNMQDINTIKTFLADIQRKKILDLYETLQTLQANIANIDKNIHQQEEALSKVQEDQKIKENNTLTIQNLTSQIETIQTEQTHLEKKREDIHIQKQALALEKRSPIEQHLITIKQTIHDINNLIQETKTTQHQILTLQEQEKILNNLSTIFSKELLLLALQDNLPILNDIINTYLAQVTNFEITIGLDKSPSDKLELLATIQDEKGEREIRSLSGGQKILLKLIWMLAISSYMRSPMLFLDETINNMDTETISKVTDLLHNFVKQKQLKFYTITHNQQIQDMDIWDKIIEL